jgi:hypothetical protein
VNDQTLDLVDHWVIERAAFPRIAKPGIVVVSMGYPGVEEDLRLEGVQAVDDFQSFMMYLLRNAKEGGRDSEFLSVAQRCCELAHVDGLGRNETELVDDVTELSG